MKKISEVMTDHVEVISPDASLREVAMKMKELDAGAIPVCDGDHLRGMITDRDIVIKAFTGNLDPSSARARDVMTKPIVYCFEDQDVEDAARIMEDKQIRRLVVLDRNKRMVGIVSLGDISTRGVSHDLSAEVLEQVSEPGHRQGDEKAA